MVCKVAAQMCMCAQYTFLLTHLLIVRGGSVSINLTVSHTRRTRLLARQQMLTIVKMNSSAWQMFYEEENVHLFGLNDILLSAECTFKADFDACH